MTPQNTFCYSSWVLRYHMCGTFSLPGHIQSTNIDVVPSDVLRAKMTHLISQPPITLLKALEYQDNGISYKITPFWKANTPTYNLWGIMSLLNGSFFSRSFWNIWEKNEKAKLSIYKIFLTQSMYIAKITPQNTFCYSSRVWRYHMCRTFTQPGHIDGPNIEVVRSGVLGA